MLYLDALDFEKSPTSRDPLRVVNSPKSKVSSWDMRHEIDLSERRLTSLFRVLEVYSDHSLWLADVLWIKSPSSLSGIVSMAERSFFRSSRMSANSLMLLIFLS